MRTRYTTCVTQNERSSNEKKPSKTLWIDVSNRINYTLSQIFGWFPMVPTSAHRFAAVRAIEYVRVYIVWSAFKRDTNRTPNGPKVPDFQHTRRETKSNRIVAVLISMQITCNRCLNLSMKWEWICRAKTKFKTKTKTETITTTANELNTWNWRWCMLKRKCIRSDVMITLAHSVFPSCNRPSRLACTLVYHLFTCDGILFRINAYLVVVVHG